MNETLVDPWQNLRKQLKNPQMSYLNCCSWIILNDCYLCSSVNLSVITHGEVGCAWLEGTWSACSASLASGGGADCDHAFLGAHSEDEVLNYNHMSSQNGGPVMLNGKPMASGVENLRHSHMKRVWPYQECRKIAWKIAVSITTGMTNWTQHVPPEPWTHKEMAHDNSNPTQNIDGWYCKALPMHLLLLENHQNMFSHVCFVSAHMYICI